MWLPRSTRKHEVAQFSGILPLTPLTPHDPGHDSLTKIHEKQCVMSTGEVRDSLRDDLLDATACLYKLGADKACHRWSFMFKSSGTETTLCEFKNYLAINHGLNDVARTFGVPKFTTTITVHRNQKEPQFPNGGVFVCNTQDEWIIYRDFLRDRKQHELIGKSYLILLLPDIYYI